MSIGNRNNREQLETFLSWAEDEWEVGENVSKKSLLEGILLTNLTLIDEIENLSDQIADMNAVKKDVTPEEDVSLPAYQFVFSGVEKLLNDWKSYSEKGYRV